MNYNEAYKVISEFSNRSLPMFADGWERWPVGEFAELIKKDLESVKVTYITLNLTETINKIDSVIIEIENRREY